MMSRVGRTRPLIKVVTSSPGSRKWFQWSGSAWVLIGETQEASVLRYETMSDSVGPIREDGPLDQAILRVDDPRINGIYWVPGSTIYDQYVSFGLQRDTAERLHTNISARLPIVDWNTLALRARASLNPNTPAVDVPVFLAELRDIPQLYKYAMEQWKKRGKPPTSSGAARANLVAQFGVLPVIRDVLSLFDFAEAVRKREEHLRRLANGGGRFKRRLENDTYYVDVSGDILYQTRVGNINAALASLLTLKRQSWFTCHASAVIPSAGDIPRLAAAVTYGVNSPSIAQLYELVPWSWLIDYFTNVGAILAAYRGGIPFTMGPPTIMVKDHIGPELIHPGPWAHGNQVTAPGPTISYIRKRRQVVTPIALPMFRMPYLSASQLSILASLLVVRNNMVRRIAS